MDPERQFYSGYVGMGNNPVSGVDPDGGYSKFGATWRNLLNGGSGIYQSGEDGGKAVWGYNKDGVSYFGEDVRTFFKEFNDSPSNYTPTPQSEVNNLPGYLLTGMGTAITGAEKKMFNEKTWFSLKTWKTYPQSWGGNGATGGKYKLAGKVATGLKWTGRGLGVYNAINIYQSYGEGRMSDSQFALEQGSNLFSTLGGVHGAAWGVGWEVGRAITNTGGYQRWKRETWLPWRSKNLGY